MPPSIASFGDQRPLGASHKHGLEAGGALDDPFDVIVIGSGAAGAIAAEAFVRAGLHTLLLEGGARLRGDAENAAVDAGATRALAGDDETGWDTKGWPWTTRNLGGGTVFYGGASFRYTDFDPGERIHVDGLQTKWPIDSAVLAPYYAEMEARLSVDRAGFMCIRRQAPASSSLPAEQLWASALRLGLVYRGPFSTVCVLDHYLDEQCPTGVGGLIYEANHDEWRQLQVNGLVLRVETILADHPAFHNRVRLSSNTDRCGLPQIMIDYTTDPRDTARLAYMVQRSTDWLKAAGANDIQYEPSNFAMGSTHLHGTCRAGDDARTSVVDANGRVHSLDNVYVADGSYMPYPGGLNPTLTIQANSLRIARLVAREAVSQGSATLAPQPASR
ncbi:MAG: FAD-binding protein [Burkholderiales bacterium]|nr:FAD-binding protein [Burkholderiales bacterium]